MVIFTFFHQPRCLGAGPKQVKMPAAEHRAAADQDGEAGGGEAVARPKADDVPVFLVLSLTWVAIFTLSLLKVGRVLFFFGYAHTFCVCVCVCMCVCWAPNRWNMPLPPLPFHRCSRTTSVAGVVAHAVGPGRRGVLVWLLGADRGDIPAGLGRDLGARSAPGAAASRAEAGRLRLRIRRTAMDQPCGRGLPGRVVHGGHCRRPHGHRRYAHTASRVAAETGVCAFCLSVPLSGLADHANTEDLIAGMFLRFRWCALRGADQGPDAAGDGHGPRGSQGDIRLVSGVLSLCGGPGAYSPLAFGKPLLSPWYHPVYPILLGAAFMILFTSSMTTVQFLLFGLLNVEFAILFGALGFVCTSVGNRLTTGTRLAPFPLPPFFSPTLFRQSLVWPTIPLTPTTHICPFASFLAAVVAKYNKKSIIVLAIAAVIGLSTVLLTVTGAPFFVIFLCLCWS